MGILRHVDAGYSKAVAVAKKHGIKYVLDNEYFSHRLVDSWKKPNTHAGKPMVCSQKCGKEFDAFAEQFK